MIRNLFTVICCLIIFSSQAQYWKEDRKMTELSPEESGLPVISIEFNVEYKYTYEDSDLVMYYTVHEITKVNNDEAIEQNNRIYINVGPGAELRDIKARTIRADGKVILLDSRNIKEIEDEESGSGYKIFAIEGAELGSEIEYLYTVRQNARYFGGNYFQNRAPIRSASFRLESPKNLKFTFKSYNGFGEITEEENEEVNIYKATDGNIPSLFPEDFATYDANRKRIEYRLDRNTASSNARILTWADAGKQVYSNTYATDPKEIKPIEKWLESLELGGLEPTKKAAKIEDYIKKNFYIDESGMASGDFGDIIKQRAGTEYGIYRLMANAFKTAQINHEIVLTSDRNRLPFDGSFESYNYLDDYLIYIPEADAYIAPADQTSRIGLTPSEYLENEGLFISEKKIRDTVYPITEIRVIKAPDYTANFDNLKVRVSFSDDAMSNDIMITRSFTGYTSSVIKSYLPLMDEERKDEMLTDFIKFISQDSDFKRKEIKEADMRWEKWDDPLVVEGELVSQGFIESAGRNILFKAGELIGPQSELYQEKERMMDVVNEYNRGYLRELIIDLPDNYVVQNADDLSIEEVTRNKEGKEIYKFHSRYELNGNQLIITIDEFYDQIHYPKEDFESFRKVINAAADFNKIVLVLKEK